MDGNANTNKRNLKVGAVVGIDKINGMDQYRVIIANMDIIGKHQYEWQFTCKMMNEESIKQAISAGGRWINITLKDNKIQGSAGSLQRFNGQHKPLVVISQLTDPSNRIIGYKVATYDGKVRNIALKELIAYGNRITKQGGVPIQNAIFVPDDENKKAHFKAYPRCYFISEIIQREKNTNTLKPNRVDVKKNEKTLKSLEDIYTNEQILALKAGKIHNVDIRIYANPALSAEQMTALMKGLTQKVNVKPFASPQYSPELMRWYIADTKAGLNIRQYLNPEYTIEQLNEISLAVEEGLDISILADVKKSPNDMAEIRERLERKIFKEELVKKDGSWS